MSRFFFLLDRSLQLYKQDWKKIPEATGMLRKCSGAADMIQNTLGFDVRKGFDEKWYEKKQPTSDTKPDNPSTPLRGSPATKKRRGGADFFQTTQDSPLKLALKRSQFRQASGIVTAQPVLKDQYKSTPDKKVTTVSRI